MSIPETIQDYLRRFSKQMGERIIETYPCLHTPGDPISPLMQTLLRRPYRVRNSQPWV